MAEDQMQNAAFGAGRFPRVMSRRPRPFGNGGAGREVGQGQDVAGNAQLPEPIRRQPRLVGRFGAQTVIDNQRETGTALRLCPVARQQGGSKAVGPAGDRDRDAGFWLERPERRDQRGEFRRGDRETLLPVQWQPLAVRAPAARAATSARGVGNCAVSDSSATQAECLSPKADCDVASPSKASCACAPCLERA